MAYWETYNSSNEFISKEDLEEEEEEILDNVRYLDPSTALILDSDGNVLKCKCGKPANYEIYVNEGYCIRCKECFSHVKD